ncbi:MAG: DUF5060 domain-containing protein, partial [Melioribacteraceae bacterium]|nr:DUF5060 domain-containing protein [Melioribacteraceae bacterium]
FEIDFYAEIRGPANIEYTLPGFFDGKNIWKIRFAPVLEGEWTITTRSDALELDNKQIKVECIPNRSEDAHGSLMVDPDNLGHFIYEDGTKFFPVGYEANWLFAMDMDTSQKDLPNLHKFSEKLIRSGFNFINMNAWAYDTEWRKGKTEETDFGPPVMQPWQGTYENTDFTRFNLAYWHHFDKVIEVLNQKGIIVCLYFKVYNKLVKWPRNGSIEDNQYYRWIIARYAAYPNIIWNLAKEAQYEKSTSYKIDRLKFIKETDPYGRMITVHDDKLTYDLGYYDNFVDFRSSQEHYDVYNVIRNQIKANDWPIFMAESGYEHGPNGLNDRAFGKSNTPEEVINYIWSIQMTGVYNAYYYTFTAWDIIRAKDNPPGYGYVKNFADFFKETNYWLLNSNDALVNRGRCLANPGVEYIVYQPQSIEFQFKIPQLPKSYSAVWYQPLSGEYIEAGKLKIGKNQLKPPENWVNVPVVLYIRKQ